MKSLKELIKTTLTEIEALNNLSEKDCLEYDDRGYDEEDVPEPWRSVANYLADKIMKIDFSKYDRTDYHSFTNCSKAMARKLGFDSVTVCAYKDRIHNPWLKSNYIAQSFAEDNGEQNTSFFVDIYNCQSLDREKLSRAFIQELFNFQRDIEWVSEGVYDEKMEEMRDC